MATGHRHLHPQSGRRIYLGTFQVAMSGDTFPASFGVGWSWVRKSVNSRLPTPRTSAARPTVPHTRSSVRKICPSGRNWGSERAALPHPSSRSQRGPVSWAQPAVPPRDRAPNAAEKRWARPDLGAFGSVQDPRTAHPPRAGRIAAPTAARSGRKSRLLPARARTVGKP